MEKSVATSLASIGRYVLKKKKEDIPLFYKCENLLVIISKSVSISGTIGNIDEKRAIQRIG